MDRWIVDNADHGGTSERKKFSILWKYYTSCGGSTSRAHRPKPEQKLVGDVFEDVAESARLLHPRIADCNGFAGFEATSSLKGAVKIFLFNVAEVRLYSIGLDGTAKGRCREATGHGSKMRYKGSSGSPVLF